MSIQSSSELQEIVISTIVKDTTLMTKVIRHIDEDFFVKYSYKLIFRALNYYYKKYSKLPRIQELLVIISDMHKPEFGDIEEIKAECTSLYDTPRYEESFVIDKLATFIRRNNVEKTLKNLLPKLQGGSDVAIEQIGEELASSLSFDIGKGTSFKLSDVDGLGDVRRDAIGSDSNPTIIKSFVEPINMSLQFKGYKPGDVVMICAEPGTGKTFFMINEGNNAALQGFNVLHLFIGDMKEYDGFIRYTSCYTGVPQDDIVAMSLEEQSNLIRRSNLNGHFNRITVAAYSAGEITVNEMIQEVKRLQDADRVHFDLILVDYADNLIPESDSMYKSGGDIYNSLSLLATSNHSTVIVGSQPKIEYWGKEIIPKEGAAESSKKQHVIDVMVTMGKASKTAKIGSFFLPKVRRGDEGRLVRWRSHYDKARIEVINETDYLQEKANLGNI